MRLVLVLFIVILHAEVLVLVLVGHFIFITELSGKSVSSLAT